MDVAPPKTGPPLETVITAEDLCLQFSAQVFKFANVLAHDASEAEDIAQEALIKAMRALPRYDRMRGDLESWLWRIVLNTAADFSRSRLRRLRLIMRLGRLPAREPFHPDLDALQRLEARELRAALQRLSGRDRTLLAMRFGADLSMRQVAQLLDLTPDAAEKGIQRALGRVRTELKEYDHA